ncbi:MAG: type III pantothenate kinase [Steroidobacteraceae bacterium]
MNTLLFDAGNTRFKWALLRGDRLGAQRAAPVGDLDAFAAWLERAPPIWRIVGVSAAGPPLERALRALLRRAERPAPDLLVASRQAAGIHNSYQEPARLGADRWAAMTAAWHLAGRRRHVCAVSIGTATTIDLVDAQGRHRGGLIAPGPALMLDALLGRTADLASRAALDSRQRVRASGAVIRPLAASTRAGIDAGCLMAAAGLVERTVAELSRSIGRRPAVYLTGGGSDAVAPLLHGATRLVPDLVLRGVAALAELPIRRRA